MREPRLLIARLLAVALLGLLPARASASVFASEGYGIWWDETDPAARGRGGTSIAWIGQGATGVANPASIAHTDYSFGFAAYAGEVADVEGAEGTFRQRSDLLPHMGGVIVLPMGFRIGGMLRTQSDASYERVVRVEDIEPATVRVLGRGGWNRLQVHGAWSEPSRRIALALGVARILGTVKEDWRYQFDDPLARDGRQVVEGRLRGAWVGLFGAVVRPEPRVSLGVTASTGGSSRLMIDSRVLEGGAFSSSRSAHQEIPAQWGVGVRVRPFPPFSVSADMMRTQWHQAAFRPGAGGGAPERFHDTTRLGVGLELDLGRGPLPPRSLRVGYASAESYVRTRTGEKVVERALSLGLRQRVGKGRASIDASLELGRRGELDRTGVEERFARLALGVSFASAPREY